MFRQKLAELKKRKQNQSDDLIDIHHEFMKVYGWIPLEEFKKLPIVTVFNLIQRINKDKLAKPVPQPVYLVRVKGFNKVD